MILRSVARGNFVAIFLVFAIIFSRREEGGEGGGEEEEN